jgi:hypothetical protein
VTRCQYVQTRLTSDEARHLQAITTIKGMTTSAYIRSLIQRDIRNPLKHQDIVLKMSGREDRY